MRFVVVVALLCGCGPDHFGTYFIADGRAAMIDFDHAEFYFGAPIGGSIATPSGIRAGDVYRRLFVPNDVAVPASDHRTATYYVPTDSGTAVGTYVLALARDSRNAVVGVADASGYPIVSARQVVEVRLPLVAADNVVTWGSSPSCIAWARGGGRADVAVVHDGDRDCDGTPATDDCNDLAYCAPNDPSCSTKPTFCSTPCSIGCQVASTCQPSLCLPNSACVSDSCRNTTTVAERLACIANRATNVRIPLTTEDRPCVDSFALPLPGATQCTDPIIDHAESLADGYTFDVSGGGDSCSFQIRAPASPGALTGTHHLLVSIDPPTGSGPRSTFLVAITGDQHTTCSDAVSTDNSFDINRCQ